MRSYRSVSSVGPTWEPWPISHNWLPSTLLSLRTKEALAAVKAAGKPLGRPRETLGKSKLDGKQEEIKTLLALRVSKASIAKITGVDRATLYHFMRSRGLIPK